MPPLQDALSGLLTAAGGAMSKDVSAVSIQDAALLSEAQALISSKTGSSAPKVADQVGSRCRQAGKRGITLGGPAKLV